MAHRPAGPGARGETSAGRAAVGRPTIAAAAQGWPDPANNGRLVRRRVRRGQVTTGARAHLGARRRGSRSGVEPPPRQDRAQHETSGRVAPVAAEVPEGVEHPRAPRRRGRARGRRAQPRRRGRAVPRRPIGALKVVAAARGRSRLRRGAAIEARTSGARDRNASEARPRATVVARPAPAAIAGRTVSNGRRARPLLAARSISRPVAPIAGQAVRNARSMTAGRRVRPAPAPIVRQAVRNARSMTAGRRVRGTPIAGQTARNAPALTVDRSVRRAAVPIAGRTVLEA